MSLFKRVPLTTEDHLAGAFGLFNDVKAKISSSIAVLSQERDYHNEQANLHAEQEMLKHDAIFKLSGLGEKIESFLN